MNVDLEQLQCAPQLGLLAAIDHSLALAIDTLVVSHPQLDAGADEFPEDLVARELASAIAQLRQVLARYYAVIDDAHPGIDDDIPF